MIDRLVDLDVQAGSIERLGDGGLAVHSDTAESQGWSVGDRVMVEFPETGAHEVTIVALYDTLEPMGERDVLATYDTNVPDAVDHYVIVDSTAGVPDDRVRCAIDALLLAVIIALFGIANTLAHRSTSAPASSVCYGPSA